MPDDFGGKPNQYAGLTDKQLEQKLRTASPAERPTIRAELEARFRRFYAEQAKAPGVKPGDSGKPEEETSSKAGWTWNGRTATPPPPRPEAATPPPGPNPKFTPRPPKTALARTLTFKQRLGRAMLAIIIGVIFWFVFMFWMLGAFESRPHYQAAPAYYPQTPYNPAPYMPYRRY